MWLVLIFSLLILPFINCTLIPSDTEGHCLKQPPSWDDAYKDLKKCCNESEKHSGFLKSEYEYESGVKCHTSIDQNDPGKDWQFDCPPGCTKDIKLKKGQFEITQDRKLKITRSDEFKVIFFSVNNKYLRT